MLRLFAIYFIALSISPSGLTASSQGRLPESFFSVLIGIAVLSKPNCPVSKEARVTIEDSKKAQSLHLTISTIFRNRQCNTPTEKSIVNEAIDLLIKYNFKANLSNEKVEGWDWNKFRM